MPELCSLFGSTGSCNCERTTAITTIATTAIVVVIAIVEIASSRSTHQPMVFCGIAGETVYEDSGPGRSIASRQLLTQRIVCPQKCRPLVVAVAGGGGGGGASRRGALGSRRYDGERWRATIRSDCRRSTCGVGNSRLCDFCCCLRSCFCCIFAIIVVVVVNSVVLCRLRRRRVGSRLYGGHSRLHGSLDGTAKAGRRG